MKVDDQAAAFTVTQAQLVELLDLPQDHRIEHIYMADTQRRPGIIVVISGPKMPFHGASDALWQIPLDRLRELLDRE